MCEIAKFFGQTFFAPKNWGNGPKIEFLNLKKNVVINFHLICSTMKIYIIFCVTAQILYLEKILFLRYRPKCSQPITDYRIFKSKKSMKQPHFLYVNTNSQKLKVDPKFFDRALSKIGVANLVSRCSNWLYFKNEQMQLTEFLHAGPNIRKDKIWFNCFWLSVVKNCYGLLIHETLKSALLKNEFIN